jgi:hypothetical protein
MSSRTFSRSMVTALLVCALLALAAPPAQAGQVAGLLGGLSAKLQSWAAAWWPAAGTDSRGGAIDPNGKSRSEAAPANRGTRGADSAKRHHGRLIVGPIRPGCTNGTDPNGHCL